MTAFRPEEDGFAFSNSFTLSHDERARLSAAAGNGIDAALTALGPFGVAGRILGLRDRAVALAASALPERYGLCGGMAFAALDYRIAGLPVPRGAGVDDQPGPGSPLRDYLTQRLLDSWVLNGATFLEWIIRLHLVPTRWPFRGGAGALRDRSAAEWAKLTRRLDAGTPVALGLVGDAHDPFLDHQIVAIGYTPIANGRGTIVAYDMNCPGAARTLEIDFSNPLLSAAETCPRPGNPLRGFFCEAYQPAVPPNL